MSTLQFMADSIEQLDLALDQLAIRDRNFDRFALMLIDNVVELTLHRVAEERQHARRLYRSRDQEDDKGLLKALGRDFDSKVAFARSLDILSEGEADSVRNLHRFRNTAYHQGRRHERILHSLAKFYFTNACVLYKKYRPPGWSSSSADVIPYRARKYISPAEDIGPFQYMGPESVESVWDRLLAVLDSLGDSLVSDLSADMEYVIDDIDSAISFLASDSPTPQSRDEVVVSSQAWDLAFSPKGLAFASLKGYTDSDPFHLVSWLERSFPWPINKDPIPSWKVRLESLRREADAHMAFKKYCDFMNQTEAFRSVIESSAMALDSAIQHQIDVMRGK